MKHDDEAYIEHIESAEIKKLINLLYSGKPENVFVHDMPLVHHEDVHDQIDTFLVKLNNSMK